MTAQATTTKRPDRYLGPGNAEFWDWCARGELRLQTCGKCGHITWPVAPECERCGSADLDWRKMSGAATLVSWCTFERDYYGGALPLPWETIMVELAEGPLFISNPVGFGWRECRLGMPLRLEFLGCEDRAGPFSLPVFAPA